jgi:hypothetical protein
MIGTFRVTSWFQGPTGSGQGGWSSARLAELVGRPVTVRLRAPVPLDVELVVEEAEDAWQCRHGELVVLEARAWTPDVGDTSAVSLDAAREAHARFPVQPHEHPVPYCFSCGLQPDGMGVHAGPLEEDPERYATHWVAPDWSAGPDGISDPAALWAALDCTAAWYASCHPTYRRSVTAQYAVDLRRGIEVGEELALVAWAGDSPDGWEGRKRWAASAAFDAAGEVVARARSLWVALPDSA